MRDPNFIWIGDGVSLARSWPEDMDFVNANLREWDWRETQVFDGGRPDRLEDFETCWTIRDGADIVGYFGMRTFADESLMSCSRFLVELTTPHVWQMKVKYVRLSRKVLGAVCGRAPSWVTDFWTLPMKAYAGTVKWQERVLGMKRVREIELEGVPHVLFHITRKETESW